MNYNESFCPEAIRMDIPYQFQGIGILLTEVQSSMLKAYY